LCCAIQNILTPPPKKITTNEHYKATLAALYPNLASLVLDEENITLALNKEYVPAGEVLKLKEGDTVALIPPISGG
jgi:molybdopterin converting factor small subunit